MLTLNRHRQQAQKPQSKHRTQDVVRPLEAFQLELDNPFHSRDIASHLQGQMSLLRNLRIRQTCPRWRPNRRPF